MTDDTNATGGLDFSSLTPVDPQADAPTSTDAAPSPAPRRSAFAWSPDVDDALETASREFGVDRSLLDTFARIESSGRANARTGSYKGLFQLSDDEFFKHGGQSNPFDPYENARAGAANLRAEKADFAKRYGRDPSAAELYMIHQQGVGGSAAHWGNPDAPAWQNMYSTADGRQKGANWARRAIWGNVPDDMKRQFGSVDNITSRDFVKLWEDKVARFGGVAPSAARPVASGPVNMAPSAPQTLANAPVQPSGQRMALGGMVDDAGADDDDDELAGGIDGSDDDGPMYLGGLQPDKGGLDFSKLKPVGTAPAMKTGGFDFSKLKPVAQAPESKDGVGDGFLENVTNLQQYKEGVKGIVPGAVSMWGGALQGVDQAGVNVEYGRHNAVLRQIAMWDRIDRGEDVPDMEDVIGYKYMSPEQKAKVRDMAAADIAEFNPTPLQDRSLFKAGSSVKEYAKGILPAAPGYEKSVGRQIGEGLGSMAGGLPFGLMGRVPAALFFGVSGAGEATERAVEFDKKERKEGREGLTQEQIALAGFYGIAPGMTDLLPLETLLGRLKLPIPEAAKGALTRAVARIGGQAFVEGMQEGGQQFLQNLIAREVYNPDQDLGEEVLPNTGIGAAVGAVAQTGKEVGTGAAKLIAGRRARSASSSPDASDDEAQKALPPPPKQITGPQGEQQPGQQPAQQTAQQQEDMPPPASAEEAGWLRARGWDDGAIADMSPEQRSAEIEEAKSQGLTPVAGPAPAPQLAPDTPTAEPITDLLAQAADLNDPKSPRSGVYVSAAGLDALDQKGAERLAQSMDENLVLENFDDKGGFLVVKDYDTAKSALEAKAAGEDLQKIIGQATGAGTGKPSNGTVVVQQRTKDGAVVRESLVAPDQVDATRKAFARAGHDVEVLSPQEALQRREEMIAAQRAASGMRPLVPGQDKMTDTWVGDGTRKAPVAIEKPEDVAAVVAPSDYSPAQGEANNRRLGHAKWNGLDISIETDGDNVRRGQTKEGREWKSRMGAPYGYFKNSLGNDNMHVDVFVGPNPASDKVYVLDENDKKTGKFRQHKTFIGFDSEADARQAYASSSNKSEDQIGGITEMPVDEFKEWLAEGKRTKPAAKEKAAPKRYDGPELSPDEIDFAVINWKFVKEAAEAPKPETLTQFVISNGGLRDDAREVRHIMGAAKERPGLVNKNGVTLDDMALKASETGFFPDLERPTIADFLDKLQDDLHTGEVVRLMDEHAVESQRMAADLAQELNDEYGVTINRFRTEESLREYFGQARRKTAEASEGDERTEGAQRKGADAAGGYIDEVPFGSEPEGGRQDAIARDEASVDERAGTVRDRKDQDQQGAEPAEGARDSGEDRGPAGAGQAGRGSDLEGARETGPSDSRGPDQLADYTGQHIDGWNEDGEQKHRFLVDARNYLTKVAKILKSEGFSAYPEKKGKPGKPVNVNKAGPAVSGDVSINVIDGEGNGVYARIEGSAGTLYKGETAGLRIFARRASDSDRYGTKSQNQWLGDALTAQDLAAKLLEIARPPSAPAAKAPDLSEAQNWWRNELTPAGRQVAAQDAGLKKNRHKVLWQHLSEDEHAALAETYAEKYKPKAEEPAPIKADTRESFIEALMSGVQDRGQEVEAPNGTTYRIDYIPKRQTYVVVSREKDSPASFTKGPAGLRSQWTRPQAAEEAADDAHLADAPAVTTEKSGQTSLVPEATTREKIAAEAKAKERKGGNEPMDVGMFGSEKDQTDLVDMAKSDGSTSDWRAERDNRVKESKAAGNKHLDQLDRSVEGMRGVAFYSVHDPKERGVVRTVANTGDVVVNWADKYSADKNLVSEHTKDGKAMVWQSWLTPFDLQDYVADKAKQEPKKPVTVQGATAIDDASRAMTGMSLAELVDLDRRFQASGFDRSLLPKGVVPMDLMNEIATRRMRGETVEPKAEKKAYDPWKGERPDKPDFDFIPNAGWRDHLMRARVYANALRIDHNGMSLEQIVKAIDEATTAHAGVPDGVKVWMSDSRLDGEEARIKGGEYKAIARRESPYAAVDGYGDTPEAAMRAAVANLKPAKPSRLGQGLGDLMGKSGGQAKAVETVAAGAKAPAETAAPVEVSDDVAAALERGKEKARAYVLRLGRQNSAEFGMMVLKDGSTKENKVSGTENFLRVDMDTAPEMWTGEPKTVDFHHNHPKSTCFSRADYTEASVRPALRRTWVHGHDGSEYWAEFKADAETLGKAYDIARAATETVDKKGMQMFRYRGHIIAQMMKQGGVIDYFADITPADAEERIEAIRAAIGEEKIADAIEDIANLKEGANGLLDRGTGSSGRRSQDVGTAPDQAAEAAAGPARGEAGDDVRPAADQKEAARGVDQAAELTPQAALENRLIGEGFKTIVEARKFAAGLGMTGTNKQVDEAIEKAVVGAARFIVAETESGRETFEALVALYENQPNLASRTGTSVANQAYSTPVPLAFVASKLAGVATADVVFEPTAGNGALLIEAGHGNNDRVIANELDPSRAAALEAQGFEVSSEDASSPDLVEPKSADAVIMNPPFGAVKDGGKSKVFKVDGWSTTAIDHAIALNALKGMTDDGRAVLILGGTKSEATEERRKDYRGKAKREFYARLYKDYNVTDHFTVSGDLYTKQGASWPVDVIVIEGRGASERKLPAAQPPEILKTWDQVAEKLPNATGRNELAARPVERQAGKPAEAGAEPTGRDGSDRKAPVGRGSERVQPEGEGKPAAVRAERAQGEPADVGSRGDNNAAKPASDRDGGRVDNAADSKPVRPRVKREAKEGASQVPYEPVSGVQALDTLIPANMATAAREAMEKVQERRGSLDDFVAERLGYKSDAEGPYFIDEKGDKKRPFAAEQIDAIASAIDNIERGTAFISGSATGIGKGRIAAGVLRYAMQKGYTPVFLTEKPDLYGDMYRDLRDIGVPEMLGREPRMFITNAGETITLDEEALAWKQEAEEARSNGEKVPPRRGKFLTGGTAPKVQENMRKIASGDDIADVIFTTYDQLNTVKGVTTPRRTFLNQIAPRSVMVLDESHNIGGGAKTGWEKKDAVMNRADFGRELASKAKGVMFSSATYAKRPDVMDLYARTDMGKAVDDPKELGELIQRGGVPMQQIVASMLAKSGQYMRHERSFDGVDYQLTPVPVNLKAYKQFSASMQAIFRFDLAVEEFRDTWGQDKLDEMGFSKSRDDGVGSGSASSVAFGSLMHNITNQMLLAIKAEQTAQQAIKAHKAGEKPVIALANTNESFIKDFAEGEDIKIGQPLDLDFSAVLERYLQRTLRVTVKGPEGEKQHLQIPVDELPLSLRQEFRAAMNEIKDGDYASLPISPIDWIRYRLGEAGMSVKEVTGRQTMIDYSKTVPTYTQRPKSEQGASGKRGSIAYFNAGKLDALILNRSGSTGVSMHASKDFKDKRRRRMILAQAEGNIDTHLQMVGRVHRTGQVIPPAYSQIAADIPAEARPTAVLMKKMASLNANTTGARSSAFTVDSVDFINEVGDKVVADVLMEDPDLNEQLGGPLRFDETSNKPKIEDVARKATGRLVLLDPDVQSRFLDQVQKAYMAEIEQLDALGENPLEAKTVDLQAKTLEKTELKPMSGDSPFLDAVRMEKVSAKAQGRAMPPSEVAGKIADAIKATKPTGSDAQVLAGLEAMGRAWGVKETDRVSTLIRKQMADEIAETSADAKESTRRRLEAQYQRWAETMGLVYPGARVRLGMQAGDLDAIVMSVERTGKAKQMGALSSWTVKMAVPDSMRQLDFPMSKLFPPNTPKPDDEKGATLMRAGTSHNDIVDAFEQARKEGRETRYIVTGNILGGFDQTRGRGRIVNFTDDKGELRPGILMGRDFSAEKFMDNRAVRFQNAGQILEFMAKAPLANVEARQGDIELSQYRDTYRIEMAAARAKAGMFFTDAAVRKALGNIEFQKRGNKMVADGLSQAAFTKAVAEMQKIGAKFEVRDQQDLAQGIVSKLTGEQEEAQTEYRTNKDGFQQRLPFKAKWGDPRYNETDRAHALGRLREIQTMPVREASWEELAQARADINEIAANLFFYRPDMTDEEVRNYDEVYFYVRDPKGNAKEPVPSFFRDRMTDEGAKDLRDFQVQGKQALDHLLAARRSGLRDLLAYGPDSGLWTAPKERKGVDPSAVGEKMRSGFYFSAGRKLAEAPDWLFRMNGQAVINWLLKKGVSRDEITHFGLQEKFGQQTNDPTPRKFTREEFQKQIADRMFDFRRKVSWLNPERSKNDYELGGTRAFRGPRIPGRGIYFEDLTAFPKKLKGGEAFPPGDFVSPHWEDELKNAAFSWRGSVREVPGWGKMVVGEEGQTDMMQGANTGRRPRVSGEDYAKLKRDHVRYNKVMDEAYVLVSQIAEMDLVRDAFGNDRDMINAWKSDLAPRLRGAEYTRDVWQGAIDNLRDAMRVQTKKYPDNFVYLNSPAWRMLEQLEKLRTDNEQFFEPGAKAKYRAETERTFTPETPLDNRYVRTMLHELLLLAASQNADSIAISTSETNDRIQINTSASAAHFYDTQLAPRLEKELRALTGDFSLNLEKVALPKPQGHPRNEKAYTVWAAKLPKDVVEKIKSKGLSMFAVGSDLEEAGVPKRTDYKSAIPDIRRAMGSILKSGRPVSINGEVVTAIHKAVDEVRGMVPAGAKVYALARVEPTEEPGIVIAVFEDQDGNEYPLAESWNYLSGIRAAYFEGNLFFVRLSPRALRDVGQFNGGIAAELGHEVTHALRWSGRLGGATWGRLLDHARSLRLLDGEFGAYLKIVGDPSADKVADVTTREVYERLYNTRENRAELMDQEEVAHLVEWYIRGELSRQQVEPVIDLLDDIVAGRVQAADREESLEREMAFAAADQGRAQRRELDRLGFYSKALEAAKALRQAKGTPEQMRAMLRTAGVKEAEIAATGLDGLLAGKTSVTKDELVRFLEESRVEVKEATYGEGLDRDQLAEREYGKPFIRLSRDEREEIDRHYENEQTKPRPKWSSYSIDPSNPTYRETVIRLENPLRREFDAITPEHTELYRKRNKTAAEQARFEELDAKWQEMQRALSASEFKSGHWSEPNVIAHARTSLQKTADGKTVFLVDELQSDWGQKLRDGGVRDEAKIADLQKRISDIEGALDGYRSEVADIARALSDKDTVAKAPQMSVPAIYNYLGYLNQEHEAKRKPPQEIIDKALDLRERIKPLNLLRAELRTAEAATPGHPLINTTDQWTTTAFRRLIRQAVEAGADYIALSPGLVQNTRPGISQVKQAQALRYNPQTGKLLYASPDVSRSGQLLYHEFDVVPADKLAEELGKDLAAKLLAQPVTTVEKAGRSAGYHELTGLGSVAIGGHGMRATYDSIYPRTLGKLLGKMDPAAGKTADMPLVSSFSGQTFDANLGRAVTTVAERRRLVPIQFHTFPLTDKVKESVMEDGQPMFAIGGVKAKTAPLSSRNLAESMESKGRDAEFILKNTGWFRGADQKWRFEIDDSAAKIVNLDQKVTTPKAGFWRSVTGKRAPGVPAWAGKGVQIGRNIKLPEILSHEKLFQAYPVLRNMRVSIITGAGVPQAHEGGAFIWKEEGGKILYSPIQIKARKKADILPYLMHEIQHYIQRKEGFQGGSASSGRVGDFDTVRLDYKATPSRQMLFGNEQFSTTTFRSQQDATGWNNRPDWRSQIAGMNAAEQTALVISDLWDALDKAPSMNGIISIDPETRGFLANKFTEYRDLPGKKADKVDEAAVREHILPALQADLMSQLRVTAQDYLGSLGEAEANAVMERLNYTPEQRRNMLVKMPKGANAGQVTPDFREAAQAVLDSARKTQAIREKWLMDQVDLGDGVSVQRWRENSLAFSRDETFDWGAELAAELDFANGRAIVYFMKHALEGEKVESKSVHAPMTDAEMTFLADKAEAYVRSINLLPTPDIRLKTDQMDIPQARLSEREVAFWKNRDPLFFIADVSKPVPRNVMAWAWSLEDGELGRMIGPELAAHMVAARNITSTEAEDAAQRILSATQDALHNEDSVSAAHQSLVDDVRMASLLKAADLERVEDFRELLNIHHSRALSKEAAEQSSAGPIELPMPVDYVTAKLDPEQWRIRDREAHAEPDKFRPVASMSLKELSGEYAALRSNPWGDETQGRIAELRSEIMARTDASGSLIPRITTAQQATVSRDLTEAINIVNRIAGREVEVQFTETMDVGSVSADQRAATERAGLSPEALGSYQRPRLNAKAIIRLATSNDDLLTTAGHEAWHHVETVLATDAERKLLSSPAEMRRMRAQVADEIGMEVADPRLAQIPDSEIRAIAFQKYRREREEGQQPHGIHIGIRRFWDRMLKVLAVVRNALAGHGIKTYEDVFEAARTGEIAGRPAQTPSPEARNSGIFRQDEAIAAEPQNVVDDVMASLIPRFVKQSVARTMRRFEVSERLDNLRVGIQDKFLPVRRIQEEMERRTGMNIPINLDTYKTEEKWQGRAQAVIEEDIKVKYVEPLLDIMRKADISRKQIDDYLYARHAEERNREIGLMHPVGHPMREAITNPDIVGGSGMSAKEARSILASARGKQKSYNDAAKLIDDMIVDTRKRLVTSGLISQKTFNEWASKFAYYVALRGFEAGTEDLGRPRTGRGLDIRGPESMQALGRRSKADSPLAYTIEQAMTSVIRAEKNRVADTLYRFIQAYPDPQLYQVYKGEYRRRLNPVTKQVESYFVPPQFVRDDTIHGVKVGGRQYYMELKDPRLARAMRGVQVDQHNAVVRGMMKVTRLYASLLTSYNPEFVISNFFRDIQTALLNVTDVATKPDNIRRQILKDATSLKSMRGVMAALYGHEGRTIFGTKRAADETMLGLKRSKGAQDYARWFDEYRRAGGKISFLEFNDVEKIQRDINKSLTRGRVRRVASKTIGLIDDVNSAVENGVRLSTYIALRKHGVGKDEAASVARNLTVNFNRKGEWSPFINMMYMFFNASVQGTTRMAQAIATSRKLQVAVASIMGAAFMVDWWNYLVAGDDDDGENRYDKIEAWKKERNMIFMTGRADGSYIQIPMPYGYNLFWFGAQQTGAVMRGAVKPHKAAVNVAGAMLDVLSPIGGASGSVAQMVAPTMIDPFVQVIENKTWFGGPIYPNKGTHNKHLPDSENAFSSVNPKFQDLARYLNSITGGNTARKGNVDISPEVIEHFFEFAGGGLAKFMNNAMTAGSRVINGEEWLPEKTPFVRRVYSKATTESRRRDFYKAWEEVDAAKFEVDNLIKNTRKGTANRDEIQAAREKNAVELKAYGFMRDTQRALSTMRKERTTIDLDREMPRADKEAKLKVIQDRENQIILRSLRQLNELKKRSKQPPRAEAAE